MPRTSSMPTSAGYNARAAVAAAAQQQPRATLSRPARGVESTPPQTPAEQQPARAFGAAAMLDEAVLDIPAYLRRSRG
jgi:hypothetical protein